MNYFTSIYNEECLYSIKARLLRDSLYNQTSGAGLYYLGRFKVNSTDIELPGGIGDLYSETAHFVNWTINGIINNNTLFPFYRAFISASKHDDILSMMTKSQINVHLAVGLNVNRTNRCRYPMYCAICSQLDIQEYGEPFFRRVHQIPNIQICPDHDCFLSRYEPPIQQLKGFNYYFLDSIKVNNATTIFNTCQVLKEVVNELNTLVSNYSFNYKQIPYTEIFSSKGYFVNGKLLRKEVNEEFVKFYQDVRNGYLKQRILESYSWVGDLILNPERVLNPFQHVLFNRFVSSLDARLSPKKEHPFGAGPWPCFNKVCNFYLKLTIEQISVVYRKSNNRFVGTFTCMCGQTYIKSYQKSESGNKEQFSIIERGELWLGELDKCLKVGMSVLEIARKLGTNNSVINKYIKRKSLNKEITS